MIEINLARHEGSTTRSKRPLVQIGWLVGGLAFLGIGFGSWTWTQSKNRDLEYLLQEKNIRTQSLVQMRETLKNREHDEAYKNFLIATLNKVNGPEKEKGSSVILLDGISRSVNSFGIWLERIQFENQIVELRGQSLVLEDIGRFIDALEDTRVITSSPMVEILDQGEKSEAVSFMIRFMFNQQVTT